MGITCRRYDGYLTDSTTTPAGAVRRGIRCEVTLGTNFLEGRGYRTSYSGSSVSIVTRLRWTTEERSWFCNRQRKEISLFSKTSRQALGLNLPTTDSVSGTLTPGVKRPGRNTAYLFLALGTSGATTLFPHPPL
jgi:hypothetical protein